VFVTYIARELRKRRRQALVVALGLALGIALTISVTAASLGVKRAQDSVLSSLYGVGTDITVSQAAERGSGGPRSFQLDSSGDTDAKDSLQVAMGKTTIDADTVAKVATANGVSTASGVLELSDVTLQQPPSSDSSSSSSSESEPGQGFGQGGPMNFDLNSLTVYGVDPASGLGSLASSTVASGRTLATTDTGTKVAVIDSNYATTNDLAVDDTMTISGKTFTVVGVVNAGTSGEGADVYIPLDVAQSLSDNKDKVTTVYVQAANADTIDTAKASITALLPDANVATTSDLAAQISGSLSSAASLASNLGTWLSIAVLAAAFGMATLFTISSVSRRVREFGTLKALGWRSRRIIAQVMGESLVTGVIGGVLGVGLGYLGAFVITKLAPSMTASVSTRLGGMAGGMPGSTSGGSGGGMGGLGDAARQAADTISVALTAPVTLASVGLALALAIGGGLVAGTFGGWRASRMRPADALRRVE
jgi:ABC-type antimicrobial peptide transport system permease subunit